MASVKEDFLLRDIETEKNILNYLEKLFTNEETKMNTPYSVVARRGS
jgi:hypothetical protein